ncbi:L,D-transpeptidase family protein [Terrihabitans sp. B22-R8]|uniref:L,D-transpeptidase family protein n=1 Tax=Terrihabitans sp. B22-R8 TaxID=3425128 RepID=UPI00403CAE19
MMKQSGILVCVLMALSAPAIAAEKLTPDTVNAADFSEKAETGNRAALLKAQIQLDRQRYSPGAIDGVFGDATEIALKAFQSAQGLKETGKLDRATWEKLGEGAEGDVLTRYTITADDVKGPFVEKIPDGIADMAALESLAYTGPREALAERFHMDEDALKALNPDADFTKEGTEIVVPALDDKRAADIKPDAVDRILIDKSDRTLKVLDKDGTVLALYPASIGSKENPAPTGDLKITGTAEKPTWTYNPDLKLEGHKDRPDKPMVVPAGPNNPVGVMWIDLDKEHFGIHGSPEPEKVGKAMSSGCVRLTNWDVTELAHLVKNGMTVTFED